MEKIKQAALEGLIRQTLIFQEIKRRHIKVTDQDIEAAVRSNFRDEKGTIDERRYRETVAGMSEEELLKIEDDLRRTLAFRKLQNLVVSEAQIKVTDQDLVEYQKKYSPKQDVKDDILRRFIFNQKAMESFENWYRQLRERARVEIYI